MTVTRRRCSPACASDTLRRGAGSTSSPPRAIPRSRPRPGSTARDRPTLQRKCLQIGIDRGGRPACALRSDGRSCTSGCDRPFDAERAAGAAHEGRLAGSELSGDRHDVARGQPFGNARADLLGLLGGEDSSSTPLVWPSCGRAGTSTSEAWASATPGGSFQRRMLCSSEWRRRMGHRGRRCASAAAPPADV